MGNWLKIGVLVAICLIPLFITPVFAPSHLEYVGDEPLSLLREAKIFHGYDKYESALELIEQALEMIEKDESFSDLKGSALFEKYHVLAKMSRHQEALEAYKKYAPIAEENTVYNTFAFNEAILLYHLGKYSKASEVMTFTILDIEDKVTQRTNRLIALGISTFHLGMILEKMGEQELANQAYAKATEYLIIPNRDCTKVNLLISFGGYVEAMEILNNMDEEVECGFGVKYLKELVQERINKYVSTSSIIKSSEIKCGRGTIENEKGQCVPERATMTTEMQQKSSNGGGCLIATATYGSELAPQVQMLREIRDNSLLQTQSGQSFMTGFNEFYYSFSPAIADYERQNPAFKETVKIAITPLITSLSILNYVEIDSEADVLGYGISLIILNLGMYFVLPAIVVHRVRKFVNPENS